MRFWSWIRRHLIFALSLMLLPGCQQIQEWWTGDKEETENWIYAPLYYETVFEGALPKFLETALQQDSRCIQLEQKRPPASLNALEYRANQDDQILTEVMHHFGYFDGRVNHRIIPLTPPSNAINPPQQKVIFSFHKGKRYRIKSVTFHCLSKTHKLNIQLKDLEDIRIKIDQKVKVEYILALKEAVTVYLQEHGFAHPTVHEPEATLDPNTHTLNVNISFDPGASTHFGDTHIQGLKNLPEDLIKNRIAWKFGESYNQTAITDTRKKLVNLNLFDGINIKSQEAQNQTTPMSIDVVEAPPRIIGFGVRYYSSEGAGIKGFWEHRNLWGQGEYLSTSIKYSPRLKQLRGSLSFIDFLAPEQTLTPRITFSKEYTKAYIAKLLDADLTLSRPLTKKLSGSIGTSAEVGHIQREDLTQRNRLWGLPLELKWDSSDSALDPESGCRAEVYVTPYTGTLGPEKGLIETEISSSIYLPLSDEIDPFVVALWGHIGSIWVKDPQNIPVNKRFFAGGGGSVRAYGFQKLGPLDSNGVPIGGRSLAEFGIEGRFHVNEKWGGVIFFEGGALTLNVLPNHKEKFRWGIGAGLRYFSPIGPIRFDIAVPVSKRRKIGRKYADSSFQFYVSIGQAF